jgi:hypothetical protein
MTATRTSRQTQGKASTSGLLWLLFVLDAALMIASGAIHFHLWDIAYRTVATLDVLFLIQGAACILAAIVLLVTRHVLIVAGCALLMAGTIVGFILAKTVGIFGFKLPFITTEAWIVLVIEAAAVIALAITGLLLNRQRTA